jgi:homoserine dehydrogenase
MINIGILGYGIVGSGVAEVCEMNQEAIMSRTGNGINIKKILDLREFPNDPFADRITHDAADIMNDPSISVVVETIGGAKIAYELTKQALAAGKHVVTSNKELVATHGPELMALAAANKVNYLFEASVGGGIPIIRPLHKCLAANVIEEITGILNGTTNYILTRMDKGGVDFDTALREAQARGYAEQNPTADVEGIDACRKIAILASIATGEFIDSRKIYTEGITDVTTEDMAYAHALDCKIKLLGTYRRTDGIRADLIVAPTLLPTSHPVAVADDVFNAIMVKGNALGDAMFYGRGAGRLPTASAVVADVIECVMHIGKLPHIKLWQATDHPNILPHGDCTVKALLRLNPSTSRKLLEKLFASYGLEEIKSVIPGEIACLVGGNPRDPLTEAILADGIADLGGMVISRIRVWQAQS